MQNLHLSNHRCALCLHQVCVVAHTITVFAKKKILIPKLHILLYLPVSSTIKTYTFQPKMAVSIYSIFIVLLLKVSGEHV